MKGSAPSAAPFWHNPPTALLLASGTLWPRYLSGTALCAPELGCRGGDRQTLEALRLALQARKRLLKTPAAHTEHVSQRARRLQHCLGLFELPKQLVDVLGVAILSRREPSTIEGSSRSAGVIERMMASTWATSPSSIESRAWRISFGIPGSNEMSPQSLLELSPGFHSGGSGTNSGSGGAGQPQFWNSAGHPGMSFKEEDEFMEMN